MKSLSFSSFVHGKMYEIFYILFANKYIEILDVETQGKKYRALRRITEYINENFCENISLDTIAQTTGLSRYYVSHLFKELMNTTFVNYVNELRLTRAAMLLTTTDTPIIEIAGMSALTTFQISTERSKCTMTPPRQSTEKQNVSLLRNTTINADAVCVGILFYRSVI